MEFTSPAPKGGGGPCTSPNRSLLFQIAALEGDDRILMRGHPRITVAIHEGDIARFPTLVFATLDQATILAFAIDGADGSILLDEGDGKELAFGLGDELVEGLHGAMGEFGLLALLVFAVADESVKQNSFEGKDKRQDCGELHFCGVVGFYSVERVLAHVSALDAPVNSILEFSAEKTGNFLAVEEKSVSVVVIAKDGHNFTELPVFGNTHLKKGCLVSAEAFTVLDAEEWFGRCHARIVAWGFSWCKDFFLFFFGDQQSAFDAQIVNSLDIFLRVHEKELVIVKRIVADHSANDRLDTVVEMQRFTLDKGMNIFAALAKHTLAARF